MALYSCFAFFVDMENVEENIRTTQIKKKGKLQFTFKRQEKYKASTNLRQMKVQERKYNQSKSITGNKET